MRTRYDAHASRWSVARGVAAYAANGLMFGLGCLPSGHRPERARDLHTLVFVHGLMANRACFYPLQGYLRLGGFERQYAYNYRSAGSIERIGVDLKRRLDREIRGGRITLIGHSMGGLVARVFLQMLGGDRRVDTLVTIGTPHLGSHAAAMLPTVFGDQLHPEGPFLRYLNALPAPRCRCVSFAAAEDRLVLPPRHALAPFGEHRVIENRGHLDVMMPGALYGSILDVLREDAQRGRRLTRRVGQVP